MSAVPRMSFVVTAENVRCLRLLQKMEIARDLAPDLVALYRKLDNVLIVDGSSVPRDVVTLGSRVVHYDPKNEIEHHGWLVFPWNDDRTAGRISVASPLGVALLGSRIGMSLRYRASPPSEYVSRVDVLDIPFQPESSCRY